MHERIVKMADAIAQATEKEMPLLDALATSAEAESAGRLRDGLTVENCEDAVICSAAMLAAAGLIACRDGGDVEQFTAGDVSVKTGSGSDNCEIAAMLRRHVSILMAPYWGDDGFAFVGVRG